MADIPPLSPKDPKVPDSSKRAPSPSDNSVNKINNVSHNIFAKSFQDGLDKLTAFFTSSGESSPKLAIPSLATSHTEYEAYLEDLFLHPVIRDISQEDLLNEGMGTQSFEDLIEQIIKDLVRKDVIILNEEPLKLGADDGDNIREIKNQIIAAASDGRIVGLLHQGIHVSLATNPAHEHLRNVDLQTFPQAVTEEERDRLDEDFWSKIELRVAPNGKIALTVSEPIALVKIDKDDERSVAHYISVKGHYEDGRITTTFTKIEPFEEIKKEDSHQQ